MPAIKTTISLEPELYKQATRVAKMLNLSRSGLARLGLQELLQKSEGRLITEHLNRVFASIRGTPEERRLRKAAKANFRRVIENTK
jgi:hypothetical protein